MFTTKLFPGMPEADTARLLGRWPGRAVQPEEWICRQGSPGRSVFVVLSGMGSLVWNAPGGEEILIRALSDGDFFGETDYFGAGTRRFSARAQSVVEVAEIPPQDLDEVLQAHPEVFTALSTQAEEAEYDVALASARLFRELHPEERGALRGKFEGLELEPGAFLLKEGEEGDALYIVQSGSLVVTTRGPSGNEVELSRLGRGDVAGEIAVITGKPRTATVRAAEKTKLLKLRTLDFNEILESYPQVLEAAQTIAEERAEGTVRTLTRKE